MPAVASLTPPKALAVIAEEAAVHDASPEELRAQGRAWRREANRIRRIASSRSKTRQAKAEDEAAQLISAARALDLAAGEIERRGENTVRHARRLRHRILLWVWPRFWKRRIA